MPVERTENRVVMITDMKGFTAATARQTREENARMLALHDALLLPLVKAFRGRCVKGIGDALLVLFGAPTEALLCAMAIQDRLWDYDRRAAEAERIEVRIAVSLGEVRVTRARGGTDVFGDAVNLASRVEAEAEPGEIWFTEAVYWVLDRAYVPFEEVGYREIKGLPEKARLFRVLRASPTAGAPEPAPSPPYGNAGLALVTGLGEPDPAALARQTRGGSGGRRAGRILRTAVAAVLAAAAGLSAYWFLLPEHERLIRRGRFDDAREAVERLGQRKGASAPEVLFARGRLEQARADAGAGGSLRGAFHLWSRALAAGSGDAAARLRDEGVSPECGRRKLAARALIDAHVPAARRGLEAISEHEPPAEDAKDPVERVKQLLSLDGRCGAGDLAREGLKGLKE